MSEVFMYRLNDHFLLFQSNIVAFAHDEHCVHLAPFLHALSSPSVRQKQAAKKDARIRKTC
jgi:hypothetical protein